MTKEISWLEFIALILMSIGALNWGLVGALDLDVLSYFLGDKTIPLRMTYITIGIAGLYYALVKIAEYFDYK